MPRYSTTDTSTASILSRIMAAREEAWAYSRDESLSPAEHKAAMSARLLLAGLLNTHTHDELREQWDAALYALEALHRSEAVGRPAAHTYRTIYKALAGR